MDIRAFCSQSRVVVVAGKGGVGKTTMVAALAHLAAGAGLSVLVVELEGRPGVSAAFGGSGGLGYAGEVLHAAGATDLGDGPVDETAVIPPGTVHARTITPDDALLEYLDDHGMKRFSKRLLSSGIIDLVAGAIPGIRDILVLGKIKQIEQQRVADLVLVDAPATGHTMTFLSSAAGLLDAARGGPIRSQAADVVALLSDPARCQVVLVTLPEEMPVNEVVEAAYQLEDRVGVALGPVIVNAAYPPVAGLEASAADTLAAAGVELHPAAVDALEAARRFRTRRHELQEEQIRRLSEELPLPQLRVPFVFAGAIGPRELDTLERGAGRRHRGAPRSGVGGAVTTADGAAAAAAQATISEVARDRSIVICCGSGGVGKTTTSAAIALQAARLGRTACVVTIDPARRLANSLGLAELTNSPTRIDGDWPGELFALMLDPKGTFDDLIARYADSEEQAEDIRVNRIYRNLTGTLSGTQEYMAMEKLHELVEEGGFDVVVVDTPPSRNALDFLDAPRRLTHFLENRVFQALMTPTRVGLRFMGVAANALLRTISKVAGADIVHDAVAFFQAFEGMEEGFRDRAARVRELLLQPDTAFVLVASPRPDSVDEAVHFAGKLVESRMSATVLIVNRVQPRFASDELLASLAPLGPSGPPAGRRDGGAVDGVADLVDNLAGYTLASDREEATYAGLVTDVDPAPVYRVPLLNSDVHDLDGLATVADLLFGQDGT